MLSSKICPSFVLLRSTFVTSSTKCRKDKAWENIKRAAKAKEDEKWEKIQNSNIFQGNIGARQEERVFTSLTFPSHLTTIFIIIFQTSNESVWHGRPIGCEPGQHVWEGRLSTSWEWVANFSRGRRCHWKIKDPFLWLKKVNKKLTNHSKKVSRECESQSWFRLPFFVERPIVLLKIFWKEFWRKKDTSPILATLHFWRGLKKKL